MQVLLYIKNHARLSINDYDGNKDLLHKDKKLRDARRVACMQTIKKLGLTGLQQFRPRSNSDGSFTVTDISITFIPDQYMPVEIWAAFNNFLKNNY